MDPTNNSTAQGLCATAVDKDLYGYGIRIGLFMQWFATALTYLVKGGGNFRRDIWLALVFFITGTAGYLVYRSVRHRANLPVDTYITMTLCFGVCYSGIPRLAWKAVCTFRRRTFWTCSLPSDRGYWIDQLEYICLFVLFLAGLGFQLWFWIVDSALELPSDCQNVGWLFVFLPLASRTLRIANLALLTALCILCVGSCTYFFHVLFDGKQREERERNTRRFREDHGNEMPRQDRNFISRGQVANCAFELATMGFVIWAVESTIRQNFGPDFRRETDAGQSIAITMGAFSLLRVFVVAYGTFARWIMDLQIARLHRDGSDSNDPLLAAPAGPYNLSAQQSNANIEMGPMRMQQPQSVAGQATAGVAGPTPGANVAPPMAFPARPNGAAPEQQPGHGLFQQFPTDQQHLYHQQGLYHQQQQQYNPHPYNPHPYQMQRSQQTEPASPLMVVPLAFNLLGQAIGDRVRRRPFR